MSYLIAKSKGVFIVYFALKYGKNSYEINMKKFLLLSLLFLSACSSQNNEQQSNDEQQDQVSNSLAFAQKQKDLANTYSETDPAVILNILDTFAITKSLYPNMAEQEFSQKHMFQMTNSSNGKITPFKVYQNWESIKAVYTEPNQVLKHIGVEVYEENSYKEAKQKTFDMCKNIWRNIDNRIPPVIDELADRINKYEDQGSSAMTSHIRYGYLISLDASHYVDGYPVACNIGYEKK